METPWSYLLAARAVEPVRHLLTALQDRWGDAVLAHAGRVATQAARYGLALRLPPAVIEEAILVGWLHVVTKSTVDTNPGLSCMDLLAAEQALRPVPGLFAVSRAVRCLAERWDGRGEPDGLLATAIPASARIVAVAAALDRVLHGRADYQGQAALAVADWLYYQSGRRFDPAVVDVALAMLALPSDETADLAAPGR